MFKEESMHIRSYLSALEYVNAKRESLGLPPLERLPVGRPGDMQRCVIARAVPGAAVNTHLEHPQVMEKLPGEVSTFVMAFDSEGIHRGQRCDPAKLVDGGIDDDKGCLVST